MSGSSWKVRLIASPVRFATTRLIGFQRQADAALEAADLPTERNYLRRKIDKARHDRSAQPTEGCAGDRRDRAREQRLKP